MRAQRICIVANYTVMLQNKLLDANETPYSLGGQGNMGLVN